MSTLSVPLTAHLEEYIKRVVRRGDAASKADVVRRALQKLAEDEAIEAVLKSEQELKEGKILRGDLRKLVKLLP